MKPLVLPCLADLSVQIMLEQNVQTFITWTHGAQPTWLQYHGPNYPAGTLLDRPFRLTASPPPPPQFLLLPPPPPPPPPPPMIIIHSSCPHCEPPLPPLPLLLEDSHARLLWSLSAHDAQFAELTNPVLTIYAVPRVPRNALHTMTTWSRMAWIETTWSPDNTARATTLPVHFRRGMEWIRVYTPGMWQPVAASTFAPPPRIGSGAVLTP